MKLLISFTGECAMKKIISLFFGLLLFPTFLYAGEHSLIFQDKSAFQIARSLKLGHAMGELEKPNKSGVEKGGLCESDTDCSSSEKCKGNTCVNVCDPNPCSSGYCLDEGNHSYSCVACLNDDHCSADKKCSGNACVDVCTGNNCTQQNKLCSSNGNHGYLCYGCTSDAACANDEFCDTTTKTCRTLCPDSCEGNLICEITGSHEAKCTCQKDEDCPEGYTCDQETKQCVAADCAGMLLASRDDVAVAIDAASFSTAMSSGKNIIAVTENLTVSSEISLGSKKLVGPKYFSDIPVCKETNTPTLSVADAITISNGEISDIGLKNSQSSTKFDFVSGSGIINNTTFNVNKVNNVVKASGTMTLNGTNVFNSSDSSSYLINAPSSADTVNINGDVTFHGKYSYGASVNGGKMTIASSGSITSDVEGHAGINVDNGATFIANGPVKFSKRHTYTIYALTTENVKIELNASGNVLTSYFSGIYCTGGSVKIAGSTSIQFQPNPNSSDGSTQTAINMHEVYSSSINSLTITAPVTVTGLKRKDKDQLLYMVGGTIDISNTITSSSNVGIVLLNAEKGSIKSNGAILGGSYFDRGYYCADTSCPIYAESGARMKIGGVCKKATSRQKIPSADDITTPPNPPFTSGC